MKEAIAAILALGLTLMPSVFRPAMMVAVIFALGLTLILSGCVKAPSDDPVESAGNYTYITIDGMTCLHKHYYQTDALTCDWSTWNGTTEKNITLGGSPR